MIEVPSVFDRPGRKISARALADVVSARYDELFTLVKAELERSGFADLIAAGLVLTGGASSVHGVVDLAERVFEMPVRIGTPQFVSSIPEVMSNPSYATGVGLLLYGFQQQYDANYTHGSMLNEGVKGLWMRMRQWFQGNF